MAQPLNVGMKCVKYMLFVSNFMFMMVAILLISFGSTIKAIYHDFELFMEDHYFSPATLTVAVGVIILLIAAFGCAAAIRESTCLVNMFAVLLTISLILEIAVSIAAYAMRANIEIFMETKMKDIMKLYGKDREAQDAVDFLQDRLNCCGMRDSTEWLIYNSNGTTPLSCCKGFPNVTIDTCDLRTYGCLDRLSFIIGESTIMLGTGALCIALVQILGIAFAIMLAKSIRRLKTEREAQRWQTRQELYLQLARGSDKSTTTPVTYTPSENPTAET